VRAAKLLRLAGVVALAVCAVAAIAEARPGGGQSYSGGGSGGGGGGGGGGDGIGALIELLIYLIILKPEVGIPIAVVVAVGFIWFRRQHSSTSASDWNSVNLVERPHRKPPADLERIRAIDDEFSIVLFEDFLFRLYATVHRARALPGGLESLSPYFAAGPRLTLSEHEPVGVPVDNVVIGSMHFTNLWVPPAVHDDSGQINFTKVDVEFESNMTTADGKLTMYAHEKWRLARAATARTRPPDSSRDFPCPNCGAKFQAGDQGQCSYCNAPTGTGAFDWLVYRIDSLKLEKRPPALSKTVAEEGTDDSTEVHHQASARMQSLVADDPQLTEQAINGRLHLIYHELNAAWSASDLRPVRGYISDGLFDYMRYWIEASQKQGLRNVLENMQLSGWTLARVVRDRHYDAITVRIWGTGLDYTVKAGSTKVVTGSKRSPRRYSEYWTLIRSARRRGPMTVDKSCPNCGAALQISMAGQCEFCSAHVTSGEFDWVLSKIEQDESYGS
jgi:predicted lipid-binding transport protein (Tim44 family)